MPVRFTFRKTERLNSKILIDKLFNDGHKNYAYPLKLLWMRHQTHENITMQTVISVSKKRFKRANKRNLIKRRIREAFRHNKQELYDYLDDSGIQICASIIYNSNHIEDYKTIESAIKDLFSQLIIKLQKQ